MTPPVVPENGRSLQERVVRALRDLEQAPTPTAAAATEPSWMVHEAMAQALTTVSDGLARAGSRAADRRRHTLLLTSVEVAEVQAALQTATDANARLRRVLVSLTPSALGGALERPGIAELHEALAGCVSPAAALDRCLSLLRCEPDVKSLAGWRAWRQELVATAVAVGSVIVLIQLASWQEDAMEKLRWRAESLLATQVAAAGRLVQLGRPRLSDSTAVDTLMHVRARALRAAHHMLHDARTDLSTILLQRFVADRGDERRRHLRLLELQLALEEAGSVAKQLSDQERRSGSHPPALLRDYFKLLDSVSTGLADPILFPLARPRDAAAPWPSLDTAATRLTQMARPGPLERLLSTHGPLEILARMLFALLFVAIGGSLIQLLSRLFGLLDARARIERIIDGHSSGLAASIAGSLTALAPLGLVAGLATGYVASDQATSSPADRATTITSVMISIDTSTNRRPASDSLAFEVLRAVGNMERSVSDLAPGLRSAMQRIDTIERNAK